MTNNLICTFLDYRSVMDQTVCSFALTYSKSIFTFALFSQFKLNF